MTWRKRQKRELHSSSSVLCDGSRRNTIIRTRDHEGRKLQPRNEAKQPMTSRPTDTTQQSTVKIAPWAVCMYFGIRWSIIYWIPQSDGRPLLSPAAYHNQSLRPNGNTIARCSAIITIFFYRNNIMVNRKISPCDIIIVEVRRAVKRSKII